MPAFYEIRWLPDGPVAQLAGSRGNYYEFSESDRLELESIPIWCHDCANISEGENLSTVEELDQQIRDLHDPMSVLYRMTRHGTVDKSLGKGDELLQDRLIELQRRRRWRVGRRSPPKCIYCGSTEITRIPVGSRVPHPEGEGMIQIDWVGMCSTSFNEWYFTPEGDRIPRNTQPTYWHYPEVDQPRQRRGFLKWLQSKLKARWSGH